MKIVELFSGVIKKIGPDYHPHYSNPDKARIALESERKKLYYAINDAGFAEREKAAKAVLDEFEEDYDVWKNWSPEFVEKTRKVRRPVGEGSVSETTSAPKRHRYTGDNAVFAFETESEAIKYASAMEKARKMYVAGEQGLASLS